MMLVTKCPNCHTVFKVVSDQLKISEGWVRCGQCNEIFDTTLNLREWDPEKPEDNIPPSIVSHEGEKAWVPNAIEPSETFQSPAQSPHAELESDAVAAPAPVAAPQKIAESWATQDVQIGTGEKPEPEFELPPLSPAQSGSAGINASNEFSHPQIESLSDGLVAEKRIALDDSEPDAEGGPFEHDYLAGQSFTSDMKQRSDPQDGIDFLSRENQESRWDRPVFRKVLGFFVVLLGLILAGQFLIQERDRIATYVPSLKPMLEELCHGFGCRVMPLRQIESMTVESSSFNRFRGETYRLSFVIRNSSDLELAKPALELTLTDSQDQAVYRRVLLPAELDPRSSTMARGEEWSESLVISLSDGNNPALLGSSKTVAGYRLLAFYP